MSLAIRRPAVSLAHYLPVTRLGRYVYTERFQEFVPVRRPGLRPQVSASQLATPKSASFILLTKARDFSTWRLLHVQTSDELEGYFKI